MKNCVVELPSRAPVPGQKANVSTTTTRMLQKACRQSQSRTGCFGSHAGALNLGCRLWPLWRSEPYPNPVTERGTLHELIANPHPRGAASEISNIQSLRDPRLPISPRKVRPCFFATRGAMPALASSENVRPDSTRKTSEVTQGRAATGIL